MEKTVYNVPHSSVKHGVTSSLHLKLNFEIIFAKLETIRLKVYIKHRSYIDHNSLMDASLYSIKLNFY